MRKIIFFLKVGEEQKLKKRERLDSKKIKIFDQM